MRWGERRARCLVAVSAIAVGAAGYALADHLVPFLVPGMAVVALGVLALVIVALGPWSAGSRERRRRPYRIFMITQYLCHLAVAVSCLVG